jgi:asparagine synthase (glutamine-hydrolysing)
MCGLAGFYSNNNIFQQSHLCSMANAISHRGPDAEGYYFKNQVGLAHKRLSIIDLSEAANQPMHSRCNNYVIVFNGEIYNYKEIAKEIERSSGLTLKTTSDTEVVLEGFALWGPAVVCKLRGMFAFAVCDKQEEKLFLFRDRLGIKPLFLFQADGNIAFASELKSFLATDIIRKKLSINYKAFNLFIHLGYIPHPHTIYKEIIKFPSGHYATISNAGVEYKEYWNLSSKISKEVITDEHEAIERTRELLISSVKGQMMSDVPFGTFLSGGVDSSLVTAIAQANSSTPINTFTIGFKEAAFNESEYARKVSAYLGTNHHEYMVGPDDIVSMLDDMNHIYDEPFADTSAIPTLIVSKLAAEHVKMVMAGDGGDELFLGYGSYKWAEKLNKNHIRFFRPLIKALLSAGNNRHKRASLLFEKVKADQLYAHIFSQENYFFSKREIAALVQDQFSEAASLPVYTEFNRKLSPAEVQAFNDICYYLCDDLLVKVDRASMQHSLEVRPPLLDHSLVELLLNISPELKNKGTSKYLLKKILFEYIPESYFQHKKWGFSIPLNKILKTKYKSRILDTLSSENINRTGYFNYDQIEKLLNDYYNKNHDHLYNRVWLTYQWIQFVDNANRSTN